MFGFVAMHGLSLAAASRGYCVVTLHGLPTAVGPPGEHRLQGA